MGLLIYPILQFHYEIKNFYMDVTSANIDFMIDAFYNSTLYLDSLEF